ncbi:MAG: ATP-binding protein [Thermodesulfobacteriota bacterium]|nr:ATP-binding protein [Thermodesulfobacteriota bacterium]
MWNYRKWKPIRMIPAGNTDLNLDLESGDYLKLTVADTGCGIDKNKLAYIFDPFFTTKEQGKGTGLGLSVVHGIIKSHNGTIEVSSEPGNGTTFEVYLPVAEVKCDDKSEKRNDELPLGNVRILFVDDEPMLANTMEGLLTSLGYEVACFTDPNQALNQFSNDNNSQDFLLA